MSSSAPSPPGWLALHDEERVWVRASPSRNLILASLTVGFALLLVMSVAVSSMTDIGTGRAVSLTVLLSIVGLLGATFLFIRRNEYVLTSTRACVGIGLGSKQVASLDYENVRDVTVVQSNWHRRLNVGTLRFVADDDTLAFTLVQNPDSLHEQAVQLVDGEL